MLKALNVAGSPIASGDTFQNINALDQSKCLNILHDKLREFIGPPTTGEATTIVSNAIPCGESISAVRVHLDQDWAGRINFKFKSDDRTDFFDAVGTWGINELGMMQQGAATGRLQYDDAFTLPANFECNTAWYYQTTGQTGQSGLIWNFTGGAPATNYYASLANEAGNMVLRLYTGGVLRQSANLTKDQNYLLKMQQTTSRITATATNIGGTTSTDSVTHAVAATAGRLVALQDLYQATAKDFYVDYFELPSQGTTTYVGKIEVYASADDGANWTSITNTAATTNKDVTIGTAGTSLRLKAVVDHPCRLYGWGISFSN